MKYRKVQYFEHMLRLPHEKIEAMEMTGLVKGVRSYGRPTISELTTPCRGLASLELDCYASHETRGVGRH